MDREQKRRVLKAAGALLALGAFAAFLVLLWRPDCLILRATGLYCPGCGGQRMLLALLRGDLPLAFRQNPLLFCLLPPAVCWALAEAVRYVRGKRLLCLSKGFQAALIAVLALTTVFAVLRNLPGFAWLRPLP